MTNQQPYPPQPSLQQSPQPLPKKPRRGLALLVVIVALVALVAIFNAVKGNTPTSPAAPAAVPSATTSDDSDFLFVVSDDLSTEGMVAAGKTDADIIGYGKEVCVELKAGKSQKSVAKAIAGAPWLVPGTASDFVDSAHTFFCPEV